MVYIWGWKMLVECVVYVVERRYLGLGLDLVVVLLLLLLLDIR